MTARLEAGLREDRDRLIVSYNVTNEGSTALWVVDEMVLPDRQDRLVLTPTAVIVVESDDRTAVRLVRGFLMPQAFVAFPLVPGARRVDPGQTVSGEGVVPLPLGAYHPQDGSRPLYFTPSRAVIEVGVIEDPDPVFEFLPLAEGGELRVPTARTAMRDQKLLASEAIELPPIS